MHITLVVTGAPLAGHCHRLVGGLVDAGHQLSVVASTSARSWTGDISPEHTPQGRIRPDAVICCPATFHTLNAWAAGLNDTPVLRVLNDAIGLPSPVLAVPMLADRLARHPADAHHRQGRPHGPTHGKPHHRTRPDRVRHRRPGCRPLRPGLAADLAPRPTPGVCLTNHQPATWCG